MNRDKITKNLIMHSNIASNKLELLASTTGYYTVNNHETKTQLITLAMLEAEGLLQKVITLRETIYVVTIKGYYKVLDNLTNKNKEKERESFRQGKVPSALN